MSSPRYIHLRTPLTTVRGEQEYPSQFALQQSYPNPFNPTTTIKYSLPSPSSFDAKGRDGQPAIGLAGAGSHVSLRVYDVLGREVAILVNEELNTGSYETTFDATGLASGVYFYRFIVDSYAETKKMLLIR